MVSSRYPLFPDSASYSPHDQICGGPTGSLRKDVRGATLPSVQYQGKKVALGGVKKDSELDARLRSPDQGSPKEPIPLPQWSQDPVSAPPTLLHTCSSSHACRQDPSAYPPVAEEVYGSVLTSQIPDRLR